MNQGEIFDMISYYDCSRYLAPCHKASGQQNSGNIPSGSMQVRKVYML